MGSITFNSLDGFSRAHTHIFEEIGEIKVLSSDDGDVMLSLSQGFFTDFTWIAGKDRKTFAARIRNVLATEPAGEWTRRGLQDWSEPESKEFAEHCREQGIRVPGLHSIVEHLEANDQHPVVITHSGSASFPTTDFADKKWLRAARKLHGEDYLDYFDELPEEEQWALTTPRLMKEEALLQWTQPLTNVAAFIKKERIEKGLWRSPTPTSKTEEEILSANSWKEMKPVLETIYTRIKPTGDELLQGNPAYIICNALDSMAIAEEFAKAQGDNLPGITHVYMQFLKMSSDWGNWKFYPYNEWIEPSAVEHPTVFLPVSVIAVADEIIKLIELLKGHIVPSKVIVLGALANAPQMHLVKDHFSNHPFEVSVLALESVNDNLLHVRDHLSKITAKSSAIQPQVSKWFWRRFVEQMKKEDEAHKQESAASLLDG